MSFELLLKSIVRQAINETLDDREARQGRENPTGSPFLRLDEAASVARVSKSTIRNWLKTKKLARHGTGRTPLVRRDELEGLLLRGQSSDDQPEVSAKVDTIMERLALKAAHTPR